MKKAISRKTMLQIIVLAIFCIYTTSCATLINGSDQPIPVTTIPPGATVTVDDTSELTPTTVTLKRDRDYVLTITMEGYKSENIKIEHVVSGAVAGNLFGFGMLGVAIDTATGAIWRLEPDNIQVELRPLSADEYFEESMRLCEKTLQVKLQALDRLREAQLITENQYMALRNITIYCVSCSDPSTEEQKL